MPGFKLPAITNIIFTTDLNIRIYDINYGGHLGHDRMVSLLHEARVRFLMKHGYTELDVDGSGMLVTNLAINYRSEAFYGDHITINIGVGEITKTSVDLHYQALHDNNKEVANAMTTITFFDYQARKVTKVPEKFLSALTL